MKNSTDWLNNLNVRLQKWRGVVYGPILRLMDRAHLTADIITNLRLIAGLIFLAWFAYAQLPAAIFILLVLISDTFDGSLARFQNKSSDRGKFLDIFVDHLIYSFIVLSLFQLGAEPITIVYNIFIMPIVYLLATIKKEEFSDSDWIIRPYPRLSYLKAFVVVPFFLAVFFRVDLLLAGLGIANVIATVLAAYYFIFIQLRWRTMDKKS
ncbi:MAG: CDP-alcohol phosphatidyltransferase family protein [bacterium]|nr:CDP-alcohol phosphatidyltransferase family protein [bacterium]